MPRVKTKTAIEHRLGCLSGVVASEASPQPSSERAAREARSGVADGSGRAARCDLAADLVELEGEG